MNSQKFRSFSIIILLCLVVLAGIGVGMLFPRPITQNIHVRLPKTEGKLTLIELAGPMADPKAEISGLAWRDQELILLPQYPERFGEGAGGLFILSKQEILDYLDGNSQTALSPRIIKLVAPGLKEKIPNFQGYEAIGFHGNQVFLTIEAGDALDMHGYIVRGEISTQNNEITLETSSLVEIPLPIVVDNFSDEALIVTGNEIVTFFEINGAGLIPKPVAQVFDFNLQKQPAVEFPSLEYRVTDAATSPDGKIWVINYFFPGDAVLLPAVDPLAKTYGQGPTHAINQHVERLVALEMSPNGLKFSNEAPVQMELLKDARNWEGLAVLDKRGFLLATDKFPSTLLAFMAMP